MNPDDKCASVIKRWLCELFALKYTDLSHHEVPPETQSEFNLIIYSPIIKGYPVAPKSLPFYIAFVNVQLSENVQSRPKLLVTSIGSVFRDTFDQNTVGIR